MLLYLHSKDATNKILTTKKHTEHTNDTKNKLQKMGLFPNPPIL